MTRQTRRRVSRRAILWRSALASGTVLVGASTLSGSALAAHAGDTVHVDADATGGSGSESDPYGSIQAGIDHADGGDTVLVRGGTYEESVTVNENVTLEGANDPDGPDAAVVDGSISVSADDATVRGLTVAPTTTFVAGGLDPYGILVTGPVSGVTVAGNVIEGMRADSTGGSVTINGIQAWNGTGGSPQEGTTIRDNVVRDMHNEGGPDWPNYGGVAAIKVQGVLDETTVAGNVVEWVHSAGWTYGVVTTHTGNAPGTSPEDTTVEGNTLARINDGSVYDVFADLDAAPYPGSAFAVDGDSDADEVTSLTHNNLLETPNGVQNKDDDGLDATCNYWGHATGPGAEGNPRGRGTGVLGDVDYRPWSVRRIGTGENVENSCVGGRDSGARDDGPGNGPP